MGRAPGVNRSSWRKSHALRTRGFGFISDFTSGAQDVAGGRFLYLLAHNVFVSPSHPPRDAWLVHEHRVEKVPQDTEPRTKGRSGSQLWKWDCPGLLARGLCPTASSGPLCLCGFINYSL